MQTIVTISQASEITGYSVSSLHRAVGNGEIRSAGKAKIKGARGAKRTLVDIALVEAWVANRPKAGRKKGQKNPVTAAAVQRIQVMERMRGEGQTFQQIADAFGITRQRVQQLIPNAPTPPPIPVTDHDHFMERVIQGDCWEWTGSVSQKGYPISHRIGSPRVYAYTVANGNAPTAFAQPDCGNGICVRPEHMVDATLEYRFCKQVAKRGDNDCWEWQGSLAGAGYGHLNEGSDKWHYAHRVSYELHYGDIPEGLWVLHHCDNPRCVNPHHLYAGTPKDNTKDRETRGRGNHPIGESHYRAKVTADQVREMRDRYANTGDTQATLAKAYGVSPMTVSQIVRRISWKHID